MSDNNGIVKKTSEYVNRLMREKLPSWMVYHNPNHTAETVEASVEIGEASKLTKSDLEIVVLAAWLHDIGYIETYEGHELKGAEMARQFLQENGYPAEGIDKVMQCILATDPSKRPGNLLEQVLCDADTANLGKKKFFEKNSLLRLETESRTRVAFSDQDWLRKSIEFVAAHDFRTKYARTEFGKRRAKNLEILDDRLRRAITAQEEINAKLGLRKERMVSKMETEKKPQRGIETMFRVVPKNHLDLSSIADHKANLMISTNAIIISIVVTLLLRKLDVHPYLVIPTLVLLASCLTAVVFAVLATRPKVSSGTFTREDIQQKKVNLLFFGNFHGMKYEDFEWGMKEMMNDSDYLYSSMIKDLYFLGQVLGKKYKYLRICYNVFMYGLIVSVVAFVIAFAYAPPGASF